MTIVASGEISLGGNATANRSVNYELGRMATSSICMDEAGVRTLAARTSAASAICMDNFYSKSGGPTAFGQSFGGGYYTGTITTPANYYLIVAPNATGCASGCQWYSPFPFPTWAASNATCNCNNGYWNTYTYHTTTNYAAGNFARTRSIGNFSDWYLPSRYEMNIMNTNRSSQPAGENFAFAYYWTSTDSYSNEACRFLCGTPATFQFAFKSYCYNSRAVRRVPF